MQLPFTTVISPSFVTPPGAPYTIHGVRGYTTRLHGIQLALGPLAAVTGLAILTIAGLADNSQLYDGEQPTNVGEFQFYVLPSTTSPVSLIVPFGEKGVEAPGPGINFPIEVSLALHGSDAAGALSCTAWGVLVPESGC